MKHVKYNFRGKNTKSTLSLRIPTEEKGALEELALLDGITITKLLRKIINEHLSGRVKEDFERMRFDEIKSELHKLKEALAVGVEVLLVASGQVNKEEASCWVEREIRE